VSKDTNVDRAAKLDTATISDALDKFGLNGACYKIAPRDGSFRMAGRAYTLLYMVCGNPPGTVGDYIDDIEPGSVLVLDNAGRESGTVWGDILTEVAHRRGVAGTVIDGLCRDRRAVPQARLPGIQQRSLDAHRQRPRATRCVQVPVSIGGVRVAPGDIVRGDADGVVVIQKRV